MNLADTLPFSRQLLSLPSESFRRPAAQAKPDEVVIDSTWSVAPESDHPIVYAAADHLSGFLKRAMGLELIEKAGERLVRLCVDPTVGASPEAHTLRVADEAIEVLGAGPEGVLQGVFRLEALMRERGGPCLPTGEESRQPLFAHRIHRSPLAPFYVEELTGYHGPPFETSSQRAEYRYPAWVEEDAGPDTFYHDHVLMRLAEHGFNGIWLRGALRKFAKVEVFPEFGESSDEILTALRRLCARAARYGIKVFLYLNEPMGLDEDDPFWEKYPQLRGVRVSHAPVACLCSSTPEVKQYLREASEYVFAQVPDLAGVILITASEYPSHCYCHQPRPEDPVELQRLVDEGLICPRCASRTPQEIIAEIITLLREGVKAGNPAAEVIAWNWSWSFYEEDPQPGVLERLPGDVIVMGDFERGQPTRALDFEYLNDEYSIKVVGPSPRFEGVAEFQRRRNLPVYAKVQIGTTHENPTVPYLSALPKIALKYQALREHGVGGLMTCWNFGNMPSLATEVANEFSWEPQPTQVEEALRRIATRHFGLQAAGDVVAGWEQMSRALEDFPGSIPVMYYGPVARGPAFLFIYDKINRTFPETWLLDTRPEGDLLDHWTEPFGPERVRDCYRAVASAWGEGVALMEQALTKVEGEDLARLKREIGVAEMFQIQLVSGANAIDFLLTRNARYEENDPTKQGELLDRLAAICRAEIENSRLALPLVEADPRLGFHGEAYGYMFNQELIEQKIAGLELVLNQRIRGSRG